MNIMKILQQAQKGNWSEVERLGDLLREARSKGEEGSINILTAQINELREANTQIQFLINIHEKVEFSKTDVDPDTTRSVINHAIAWGLQNAKEQGLFKKKEQMPLLNPASLREGSDIQ